LLPRAAGLGAAQVVGLGSVGQIIVRPVLPAVVGEVLAPQDFIAVHIAAGWLLQS
jgi:hypothetical protein